MVTVKRPDFPEIVRRARRLSAEKFVILKSEEDACYSAQVDGVALIQAKFNHREDAEFFVNGADDVETLVRYALWLEERLGFVANKTAFENESGDPVLPHAAGGIVGNPVIPKFGENGGRVAVLREVFEP